MNQESRRGFLGKGFTALAAAGSLYLPPDANERIVKASKLTAAEHLAKQLNQSIYEPVGNDTETIELWMDPTIPLSNFAPEYYDEYHGDLFEFEGYGFEGIASYYTREGCVDCRDDLMMTNEEILNDYVPTFASQIFPIFRRPSKYNDPRENKYALVRGPGGAIISRSTDRGGFYLADLNWMTHVAVGNIEQKTRIQILPLVLKPGIEPEEIIEQNRRLRNAA